MIRVVPDGCDRIGARRHELVSRKMDTVLGWRTHNYDYVSSIYYYAMTLCALTIKSRPFSRIDRLSLSFDRGLRMSISQ